MIDFLFLGLLIQGLGAATTHLNLSREALDQFPSISDLPYVGQLKPSMVLDIEIGIAEAASTNKGT